MPISDTTLSPRPSSSVRSPFPLFHPHLSELQPKRHRRHGSLHFETGVVSSMTHPSLTRCNMFIHGLSVTLP